MKHYSRVAGLGLLLTVMASFLMTSVSHAQSGQVRVSARRYIRVIKPMELQGRDLDKYRDFSMADAVRYYSGAMFKDYRGLAGFNTINVRSMGSDRMGVFYNGVELRNGMNGTVDLSKFALDGVYNLSLYSGSKGDIFQSANDFASAGSLYITTIRPRFKEGSKTNFRAGMRGGSFWLLNPSFLVEHDLGHYLYATVSAEVLSCAGNFPYSYQRKNAKGDIIYDIRGERENNQVNATRIQASLHGIFDKGVWAIYGYNYNSQRGIPGAIVNNISYRGEELSERNSFVQGDVKIDVVPGYRTMVNYKFSHDYQRYMNNDDKVVKIDDAYTRFEGYLSNSHLVAIMNNWDASAAYDVLYASMQKQDVLTGKSDPNFPNPWLVNQKASLATQYSYKSLQLQASVYGTYQLNFGTTGKMHYKDEMGVSPTLLVAWAPYVRGVRSNKGLAVQAFVKHVYRIPTLNDRYVSKVIGQTLNPEQMWFYNLGVVYEQATDGVVRDFGFNLAGYFQDVKDKIISYPQGQLYRWSMTNLGKVFIYGGDAAFQMKMRIAGEVNISAKAQYTFQIAQDMTNPNSTYYKNQIPYVPWNSGSAILNVTWKGIALNYSFLYVGTRYSRLENIPYYKLQPWYTHDISVGYRFKVADWTLRCMAEVNNILGQDFEIVPNYPMPKQTFRLSFFAEI